MGLVDLDGELRERPYTLRQLLGHTSGLADYGHLGNYHRAVAAGDPPWPRDKVYDLILGKELLFRPGQGWSYSNVGYILARDVIEAAANQPLARVVSDLICKPLCLSSVELAETREAFSKLHWDAAKKYDPRWVYHGCLTGTVPDAACLLHALFQGVLLKPETLRQMLARRPLGSAIPGRPWVGHGYALGLMSGEVAGQGRAIGHSGVGPFSVNAVYHFPDMPDPVTVACFTDGTDEGAAEWRCAELAKAQ